MTTFVTNRKAVFNFEFLEKKEAGIELLGFEVVAVKKGQATLDGAYVTVRGGEVFITGMSITPIQPKNAPKDYDLIRPRKLLLTKSEILDLEKVEKQKGLTIVPISMYNKGRKIKVEIAVARGKKKFDKRESIKARDVDRDVQRTLRDR